MQGLHPRRRHLPGRRQPALLRKNKSAIRSTSTASSARSIRRPISSILQMHDVAVVGSSPEMLVKVQGRDVFYRPIAGTRRARQRRSRRPAPRKTKCSPAKKNAPSTSCSSISAATISAASANTARVKVEQLMTVERYSHVMHLVSSLRGRLREDVDCFDALMACFPAGTVSGAPKVRAMEIIEELERTRRGIYAGGVLYTWISPAISTPASPSHHGRQKWRRARASRRRHRRRFHPRRRIPGNASTNRAPYSPPWKRASNAGTPSRVERQRKRPK